MKPFSEINAIGPESNRNGDRENPESSPSKLTLGDDLTRNVRVVEAVREIHRKLLSLYKYKLLCE